MTTEHENEGTSVGDGLDGGVNCRNGKYQEMREACETYLQPKGNMQSREDYVVRAFTRKNEFDRVCGPDAVLSVLNELDSLRAVVDSLKNRNERLNTENAALNDYCAKVEQQLAAANRLTDNHRAALERGLMCANVLLTKQKVGDGQFLKQAQADVDLIEAALSGIPEADGEANDVQAAAGGLMQTPI